MEVLLQYLDDIDDIIGVIGLCFERLRAAFVTLFAIVFAAACVASGVLLALVHQRIALATCVLLFVALLYRLATVAPPTEARAT